MKPLIEILKDRLSDVEAELVKCRTTVMEDGWQTQKHSKKSLKWDYYSQEKMRILRSIDEIENEEINGK